MLRPEVFAFPVPRTPALPVECVVHPVSCERQQLMLGKVTPPSIPGGNLTNHTSVAVPVAPF